MSRARLLPALALLALSACAAPQPAVSPEEAALLAAVPPLQGWVEETRGASIGAPVSATVTAPPLPRHLQTVLPEATAGRDRALLSALGFFGPRREDRDAVLAELPPEPGASWSFPQGELLLAANASGDDPGLQGAIVHGLAHALQDHRFQARQWLERLTPPAYDRRDETIAWTLLVEGEATYLQTLRDGAPDPQALRKQADAAIASGDLGRAIGALGPLGASIVAGLRGPHGEWGPIDHLFERRPESTEQLLHPEKLTGKRRDDPVRFKLPDVSRALGKGWRLIDEDSLGELLLRVLFAKLTGDPQLEACAGWDGDRLQVYRHPSEVYCAFVWLSTWDTKQDAAQFAAALKKARAGATGPLETAVVRLRETEVWVGGLGFAEVDPTAAKVAFERAFRELRRSDRHPGGWHVPHHSGSE